jgi:phosphonatase-like hydrolase
MPDYQLVVFDMAGTTVRDQNEVETCFLQAAKNADVRTNAEQILAMMGWSKRLVFETLLKAQLGPDAPDLDARVDAAYDEFRRVLENHYNTAEVVPADGALECFDWLHSQNIAIALTTGFYRVVTDIILARLGWDQGLDAQYVGTKESLIQASICSEDVSKGRPAPDMLHRAMKLTGVTDPQRVIKIGDTPSDLQAGHNAGVGLNLGVTNGTHTAEQLKLHPHDRLIASLHELKPLIAG